jgi:hypothetical protein
VSRHVFGVQIKVWATGTWHLLVLKGSYCSQSNDKKPAELTSDGNETCLAMCPQGTCHPKGVLGKAGVSVLLTESILNQHSKHREPGVWACHPLQFGQISTS